jgi:hypothetical protein
VYIATRVRGTRDDAAAGPRAVTLGTYTAPATSCACVRVPCAFGLKSVVSCGVLQQSEGSERAGVPNGSTGFQTAAARATVSAAAECVAIAGSRPDTDRGPCAHLSSRAHRLREKYRFLDWSWNFQGEWRGNLPRCVAHSSLSSHAARHHQRSVRCRRC